jgi:hypothetical protein
MPTQTHIFDNRNNGYGYLNTAMCGVCRLLKFYLGGLEGLPRVRIMKLLFQARFVKFMGYVT